MRSVLITGTSIGIGRATAVVLASRGWRVFATMRKLQKRSLLEQALKEAGIGAFARLKSFSEGLDPKPPAAESNEALFGTSAVAWSAIFASDSLCGFIALFERTAVVIYNGDRSADRLPSPLVKRIEKLSEGVGKRFCSPSARRAATPPKPSRRSKRMMVERQM